MGCDQFGGKTVQLARLARASIFDDQVLPDTPIGRLSDTEWGCRLDRQTGAIELWERYVLR